MKTKVGVGSSSKTDSKQAGIEAASNALKNGNMDNASFAFMFCSGMHKAHEFMEGVISILGDIPKIGGSALGIITNNYIGYEGYEAGVTVFETENFTFKLFKQGNLDKDEATAGAEIGKQIQAAAHPDDKSLFVFYDSLKQTNPPMLNFATYIFNALEQYIPSNVTCAGGGLLGDMQLSGTVYQFYNNEVLTQHVIAVMLNGNCEMNNIILHGCKPGGTYLTITKAEGPVIYEIDDRPALDVIDSLLGSDNDIKWKDFSLYITLGLNRGDKFGDFNEEDYANRLTLGVMEDKKALIMFEPDLKAGDEVQLMRRSLDLKYIHTGIEELFSKNKLPNKLFSLYIDCAGRAKPHAGVEFEEAAEVQKVIGDAMPMLGFYSGVEIAKVGENLQALDWTGVLCMISE